MLSNLLEPTIWPWLAEGTDSKEYTMRTGPGGVAGNRIFDRPNTDLNKGKFSLPLRCLTREQVEILRGWRRATPPTVIIEPEEGVFWLGLLPAEFAPTGFRRAGPGYAQMVLEIDILGDSPIPIPGP